MYNDIVIIQILVGDYFLKICLETEGFPAAQIPVSEGGFLLKKLLYGNIL